MDGQVGRRAGESEVAGGSAGFLAGGPAGHEPVGADPGSEVVGDPEHAECEHPPPVEAVGEGGNVVAGGDDERPQVEPGRVGRERPHRLERAKAVVGTAVVAGVGGDRHDRRPAAHGLCGDRRIDAPADQRDQPGL